MQRLLVCWGGLLVPALLALPGCGDSSVGRVSGKVTVDTQLVEEGTIAFYPEDGKTRTSGGPIKKGIYSVEVPVGTMLVRISMPKIVGKKKLYNTPDSLERNLTAEALPARYNTETELRLEVTPGTVTKDWELSSK
jgi:hypothetical protein